MVLFIMTKFVNFIVFYIIERNIIDVIFYLVIVWKIMEFVNFVIINKIIFYV